MLKKIMPAVLLATSLVLTAHADSALKIPGFTSYVDLDPHTGEPTATNDLLNTFWYGELKHTGPLQCRAEVQVPEEKTATLRLTVAGQSTDVKVTGGEDPLMVSFGTFDITNAGYCKFTLQSLDNENIDRDSVRNLVIDGAAAADAHFNLKQRNNAASVHLAYPTKGFTDVDAYYCEVTAQTDPIWSYYEANGFQRGYLGMQVNGPNERRIIFSVWDDISEKVSRSKVAAQNRTMLLAKGEGVNAGDFGNEGTGGHSDLRYLWKTGETQRFLLTAQPSGTNDAIYSGYYFRPDTRQWMLISSWRAPNAEGRLHGWYSFNEDFVGDNAYLRRKALFGNQWFRTADGQWHEQTVATFSHDETGKADRLDRFMGIEDGQFFLSNGGFIPGFTRYGTKFTRPATGRPPADIPVADLP